MVEPHTLALYLALGVFASAMLAFGLLILKSRAESLPPAHGHKALRAIVQWLCDPVWLGGLGVETVGYTLYVIALAGAPVSLVAVMMQGGIAMFVMFAALHLGERARAREWIGIGGTITAMLLLALSLESNIAEGATNGSALALATAVAILTAAVPYTSTHLRKNASAGAIASGIAFGLGSLYVKALAELFLATSGVPLALRMLEAPWLYLAAAANIAGLVLLQNAFHVTRGIIAMPLSSACSNVVPILGGMVVFAERLPPDPVAAAMRVAAFALTIASGALLAVAQGSALAPVELRSSGAASGG
jgi:hypothetical protein